MEVYRVIEVTRGFDADLSFRERSDEESDRAAVILSEAKDLLLYRERSFVAALLRMTTWSLRSK
jgi:hypothetical protein